MAVRELKDENNIDSIRTTNSKCTHFKCLELCKPIYPELMSAHYANLVLCQQTFISLTPITSLNHQKILQRYQVQWYKFLLWSHNSIHESKFNFTTCYIIHTRAFHSKWSFTTPQSHNDNDTESNIERETNVDDGIGWYSDTSTCSNSKHTHFKCLELWKPI
jgi:hypothetical protein